MKKFFAILLNIFINFGKMGFYGVFILDKDHPLRNPFAYKKGKTHTPGMR